MKHKNHLFIANTTTNSFKRSFAKRKLGIIISIAAIFIALCGFSAFSDHAKIESIGSISLAIVGAGGVTLETKTLKDKRGKIVTEMEALMKKAKDEKRELTTEESIKWDELDTKQENLFSEIKRVEKMYALTSTQEDVIRENADKQGKSADELKEENQKRVRAYIRYLAVGERELKDEERALLIRGAQSTTNTEGGYLIPQEFSNEYDKAMLAFGGVMEVVRSITTKSGADLLWPNTDDTSRKSVILDENTAAGNNKDAVFGSTTLKAFMYSTDVLKVSLQLLQDSGIDVVKVIAELLAERDARGLNYDFTVGAGATTPKGVVVCSGAGNTLAATNALTFAEIIDLEHSVNSAYRKNGVFMMHDTTLKAIKKLQIGSADSRPLWESGITKIGTPPTILGYKYVINDDMDSIASGAGKKVMLFGDFKSYIIRNVMDYKLLRLDELFAQSLQVGFLGFSRHDGRSVFGNANGKEPFKHMKTAAS